MKRYRWSILWKDLRCLFSQQVIIAMSSGHLVWLIFPKRGFALCNEIKEMWSWMAVGVNTTCHSSAINVPWRNHVHWFSFWTNTRGEITKNDSSDWNIHLRFRRQHIRVTKLLVHLSESRHRFRRALQAPELDRSAVTARPSNSHHQIHR